MKLRVHFHSDCPFFAGCENMLVNLWQSPELRQSCEISFSYRASAAYTTGLHKKINLDFPLYPLSLPDIPDLGHNAPNLPHWLKRGLQLLLRVLLWYPVFLYDVLVLGKLFWRIKPQILHINNGGYPGALSCRAAVVAARICGIRNVLMVVNNLAIPYSVRGRWLDYPIDRLVVSANSTFVTGSQAAATRLRQVLKLEPERVVPLHNGIEPRALTESAAETRERLGLGNFKGVVFGVVALMERRKGHRILLEALEYLSRNDFVTLSNIMLVLEGDGPLRAELEAFVLAHNLKEQVRFVGVESNVFNFINMLDVLVLSSIDNEDFPNVILEGMALGKSVIASHLAGTPEQVIAGETGLLVPPGDSASLANALRSLTLDHGLRAEFGMKGLQRFKENFTARKAVGRYLHSYQELIGS
jgi:glycosyltransferase involved in cell wall biosynthesis